MGISTANKKEVFLPDDFFKIDNRYFKKLRETKDIKADPSYWFDSESPVCNILSNKNVQKYRIDFNSGLKDEKFILIDAISKWDDQKYNYNNITVCSSATSASFIVLGFLQNKVDSIIFETPAYYASIIQAKKLGFRVQYIPTYFSDNFQIEETSIKFIKSAKTAKAIWVSQPRFGIGINQNKDLLSNVLKCLTDKDFLIIDEATEQLFPAFLNEFNFRYRKNIIKLRSFLKPTGLNGPRLSYILHDTGYRISVQSYLELVQGAIDCFSLEYTCKLLQNITYFQEMLIISNKYVKNIARKIELITRGTVIVNIPLENGYIGSVAIKLYNEGNFLKERNRFLLYCNKVKVPVILGSAMYFAIDNTFEFIRINYFNSEFNITNGIHLLLKFR
jgi:aspartate/methionine/tyrosine aminotransferase